MPNYLDLAAQRERFTPQNEPIPGTVPNDGGGYSFPVDDWTRFTRFLIMGAEGGTFYVGERALVTESIASIDACLAADGRRTVDLIVDVSVNGRAAKQSPTLFSLARACAAKDLETRQYALSQLGAVCRTGSMLLEWAGYVDQMRGWGVTMVRAVQRWFDEPNAEDHERFDRNLELQLAKYKQRGGWSMRDLLRLSKPRPLRGSRRDAALAWAVGKDHEARSEWLRAVEELKPDTPIDHAARVIFDYRLPWEVVPSELLAKPEIWRALQRGMGYTALVRNLGRMTANGALARDTVGAVVQRLITPEAIAGSRIHPMTVLIAQRQYALGQGDRGKLHWQPLGSVIDALDEAFYVAFGNVEPTGKRILLAVDDSGSMEATTGIAGAKLTAREAATAMAMVAVHSEQDPCIVHFSSTCGPVGLSRRQRLDDAMRTIPRTGSGTDCSLPILFALENRVAIDCFVLYTDSVTWAGHQHVVQALREYRRKAQIPAKLVVVAMQPNRFTIADPNDAGMLDVVGFDTDTPNLIAGFVADKF